MPILRHPTFNDVTQDVPDADKAAWLAQGWLEDAPEPTRARPAMTPTAAPKED